MCHDPCCFLGICTLSSLGAGTKREHIMAHTINVPMKFRFIKLPVDWTVRSSPHPKRGSLTYFHGVPKKIDFEEDRLKELDGWNCRNEFLRLRQGDMDAARTFLEQVGMWDFDPGSELPYWPIRRLIVEPERLWNFHCDIGTALQPEHQKSFIRQVGPEFPTPRSLLDLIGKPHPSNLFPVRFELTNVAAGVVTLTNACQMIRATVLADIARGIKFRVCEREDCGRTFPLESEHERKYCSQYCGHLESVRRQRRAVRNSKRKQKQPGQRT